MNDVGERSMVADVVDGALRFLGDDAVEHAAAVGVLLVARCDRDRETARARRPAGRRDGDRSGGRGLAARGGPRRSRSRAGSVRSRRGAERGRRRWRGRARKGKKRMGRQQGKTAADVPSSVRGYSKGEPAVGKESTKRCGARRFERRWRRRRAAVRLDVRGLLCPIPILRTAQRMRDLPAGRAAGGAGRRSRDRRGHAGLVRGDGQSVGRAGARG